MRVTRVHARCVYAEMVRACCVCIGRLSLHCTAVHQAGLDGLAGHLYTQTMICDLPKSNFQNNLQLYFPSRIPPPLLLQKPKELKHHPSLMMNFAHLSKCKFREQKNPHPYPPFKVGIFCCFLQVDRNTQHCMEGMGEEDLYFPILKSIKRQRAPSGRSASTNFVADCSLIEYVWQFSVLMVG